MKTTKHLFMLLAFVPTTLAIFSSFKAGSQKEPWREDQLMEPAALAKIMENPEGQQAIVYSVGPGGLIKNSTEVGPAKEKENLARFKNDLSRLPKDAPIVIYCGCCPFDRCPNIRPAFKLLNKMKFKNARLLNLRHNLKADWIDQHYPVKEE